MTQAQMGLDQFLRRSKLPSFPAVAVKLMDILAQEAVSLPTIGKLMMTDAAFSAEVLRAANSPLFGARSEVKSITHALATLGLNRVSMLVATTALWRSIPGSINRQHVRAWWRHNLAAAILAKHLEDLEPRRGDEVGYTAGLLHSSGQLAMLGAYPAEYNELLARAAEKGVSVAECERETFGMDHCEVGAALLSDWHAPAEAVEGARYHHDPASGSYRSTWLVHIACESANYLGYCAVSQRRRSYDELSDEVKKVVDDEDLWAGVDEKVNALEASLL